MNIQFKYKQNIIITALLTFNTFIKKLQQLKFQAKEVIGQLYNCLVERQILHKQTIELKRQQISKDGRYSVYVRAQEYANVEAAELIVKIQKIIKNMVNIFVCQQEIIDGMDKIYKNINFIQQIVDKQTENLIFKDVNSKQFNYCISFIQLYELVRLLTNQYKIQIKFILDKWKKIMTLWLGSQKLDNKQIFMKQVNIFLLHISFETYITKAYVEQWSQQFGLLGYKTKLI